MDESNTIKHGFVIRRKSDGKFHQYKRWWDGVSFYGRLEEASFFRNKEKDALDHGEGFLPATRDAAGHITLTENEQK